MDRRRAVLVAAAAVAFVAVVAIYAETVVPLSVGSWAVKGMQEDVDRIDGRPTYVLGYAPDLAGLRFGLLLRNDTLLPATVRLAPEPPPGVGLDDLTGLRVCRPEAGDGCFAEEATMAVEAIEIPAWAERWVIFEGRFAGCDMVRSGGPDWVATRGSVHLEASILGFEREVDLALPFVQRLGPPPAAACP